MRARPLDEEQRGDLADALLDRRQADQLAVELRRAPPRRRSSRTPRAGRRRRLGGASLRLQCRSGHGVLAVTGRRASPGGAHGARSGQASARNARLPACRSRRRGSCSGSLRPSRSWRSSRKPGSFVGRLTMKRHARRLPAARASRRRRRGCSGCGNVLRQSLISIRMPAGSFRSNIGLPHISQ